MSRNERTGAGEQEEQETSFSSKEEEEKETSFSLEEWGNDFLPKEEKEDLILFEGGD